MKVGEFQVGELVWFTPSFNEYGYYVGIKFLSEDGKMAMVAENHEKWKVVGADSLSKSEPVLKGAR